MHRDAPLFAVRRDQQQRLLAEHEHRRVAEEMHGHDRRARGDRRVRSTTEGMLVRDVGHRIGAFSGESDTGFGAEMRPLRR